MNAISSTASSIDAVNQLLQTANAEMIKQAEKMVKVSVEMALASEAGKGEAVDVSA